MDFWIVIVFLAIFATVVCIGLIPGIIRSYNRSLWPPNPKPVSQFAVRHTEAQIYHPPIAAVVPTVAPLSFPELEGISFADDGETLFTNEKFDQMVEKKFGDRLERFFFTTLAGTSHRNADRTSRTAAIRKCAPLDVLEFVHDEANEYSKHAVRVTTEEGKQLGFLPDRTGVDVLKDRECGCEVVGLFRHRNHHPETGKVIGGTIALVYLK
jgi:hypothetical protein